MANQASQNIAADLHAQGDELIKRGLEMKKLADKVASASTASNVAGVTGKEAVSTGLNGERVQSYFAVSKVILFSAIPGI